MGFSARFDLRHQQPTFDFFTWLCHVKTQGADEIVLQTRKVSDRLSRWTDIPERVESILKPGPALAGLPCREGEDGEQGGTGQFAAFLKNHGPKFKFPRLKSVLQPAQHRYTVTLRKSAQKPWRNSDEVVWRSFAEEIGAFVIEDYSVQPISLHERMALYAGAKMNFFVTSGPAQMLFFTDYPLMMFGCNLAPKAFDRIGISNRGQVPWARDDQTMIWETPTRDVLRKHFDTMPA